MNPQIVSIFASTKLDENPIDEDLWIEILKRIPVQALCRLRSVSKSWNSVISSPFFIKLQSLTASTTPFIEKPYLLHSPRSAFHLYHPQDLFHHFRTVQFPLALHLDLDFEVVDVIHGVVCVSRSKFCLFKYTVIFNPAIIRYILVPLPPEKEVSINLGLGFGYDSSKSDFKVVRVRIPSAESISFDVFSSRLGLWREVIVDDIKSYGLITTMGCFLNGTIHWVVTRGKYWLLMFDCEQEQLRVMELPEEMNQVSPGAITKMLKYSGRLSVLMYFIFEDKYLLELWVMEGYGWKKLFRVPEAIRDKSPWFSPRELFITNSANAVIMLREDDDVFQPNLRRLDWYNPNQWMKLRGIKRHYQTFTGHHYEESMLLIDEPNAQSYAQVEDVLYSSRQMGDVYYLCEQMMKSWPKILTSSNLYL